MSQNAMPLGMMMMIDDNDGCGSDDDDHKTGSLPYYQSLSST